MLKALKKIPEVQALLAKHPDYDIKVVPKVKTKVKSKVTYTGVEVKTPSQRSYLVSFTLQGEVAVSSSLTTKEILDKLSIAQSIIGQLITPERTASINAISATPFQTLCQSKTYALYDVAYAIFDGANDEIWNFHNVTGSFEMKA